MPFTLPVWTNVADLFVLGNPPNLNLPDLTGVPCQIYFNSRNQGQNIVPFLRFDKTVMDTKTFNVFTGTCCRVWSQTLVVKMDYWMQDPALIHAGFPNAYYMCEGYQIGGDGVTFVPTFMWDPTL